MFTMRRALLVAVTLLLLVACDSGSTTTTAPITTTTTTVATTTTTAVTTTTAPVAVDVLALPEAAAEMGPEWTEVLFVPYGDTDDTLGTSEFPIFGGPGWKAALVAMGFPAAS